MQRDNECIQRRDFSTGRGMSSKGNKGHGLLRNDHSRAKNFKEDEICPPTFAQYVPLPKNKVDTYTNRAKTLAEMKQLLAKRKNYV